MDRKKLIEAAPTAWRRAVTAVRLGWPKAADQALSAGKVVSTDPPYYAKVVHPAGERVTVGEALLALNADRAAAEACRWTVCAWHARLAG